MNNSLIIVGHVGQTPKAVSFGESGNKVVKFSVAVKEYSGKDADEKVLWVDCEAWNGLGDRALKVVSKGREIVVQGRLALNSFTKTEGDKTLDITKPVLKVASFQVCGKKPPAKDETQEAADE